jgi:hypothetical protein
MFISIIAVQLLGLAADACDSEIWQGIDELA